MRVAGMIYNEIDYYSNAALMCFIHKVLEVLERAVIGVYRVIIGYVVFVVGRRGMYWHKPYSVEAHFLDIIELCRYAVEISYTVVVGVVEAVHEYLVPVTVVVVYNVQHDIILFAVLFISFARGKRGKRREEE